MAAARKTEKPKFKRFKGRVRAKKKCFVGNTIRNIGDEFIYDGDLNTNVLTPVSDEEPRKIPTRPSQGEE